jgi:hypothetical protein
MEEALLQNVKVHRPSQQLVHDPHNRHNFHKCKRSGPSHDHNNFPFVFELLSITLRSWVVGGFIVHHFPLHA